MFNSNPPLSAADVAAVVGNQNNGNGFGWGNDWWIIILFALFGWGNGGYGFGGNAGGRGCCGAATSADIQRGSRSSSQPAGKPACWCSACLPQCRPGWRW